MQQTEEIKLQALTTKKQPVVDDLHGHKIVDDYRWLEEDDSSEVKD